MLKKISFETKIMKPCQDNKKNCNENCVTVATGIVGLALSETSPGRHLGKVSEACNHILKETSY